MTAPLRLAWLTTGRGPGSAGALEHLFAAIDGGLPVELAVVFLNRDPGEAAATDRLMEAIRARGVPVETRSSVAFRRARGGARSKPGEPLPAWRAAYDEAVASALAPYAFDLGVMFGYMLIATEPLYGRFTFINDHPALPDGPTGTYQEVIEQLIRTRASESGCMWHVVTGDVDRGPAVAFCRYAIRDATMAPLWDAPMDPDAFDGTPLYAEIRRRGVERERVLLAETLRAVAEGRLAIPPPAGPLDLTEAVEATVGG